MYTFYCLNFFNHQHKLYLLNKKEKSLYTFSLDSILLIFIYLAEIFICCNFSHNTVTIAYEIKTLLIDFISARSYSIPVQHHAQYSVNQDASGSFPTPGI